MLVSQCNTIGGESKGKPIYQVHFPKRISEPCLRFSAKLGVENATQFHVHRTKDYFTTIIQKSELPICQDDAKGDNLTFPTIAKKLFYFIIFLEIFGIHYMPGISCHHADGANTAHWSAMSLLFRNFFFSYIEF